MDFREKDCHCWTKAVFMPEWEIGLLRYMITTLFISIAGAIISFGCSRFHHRTPWSPFIVCRRTNSLYRCNQLHLSIQFCKLYLPPVFLGRRILLRSHIWLPFRYGRFVFTPFSIASYWIFLSFLSLWLLFLDKVSQPSSLLNGSLNLRFFIFHDLILSNEFSRLVVVIFLVLISQFPFLVESMLPLRRHL